VQSLGDSRPRHNLLRMGSINCPSASARDRVCSPDLDELPERLPLRSVRPGGTTEPSLTCTHEPQAAVASVPTPSGLGQPSTKPVAPHSGSCTRWVVTVDRSNQAHRGCVQREIHGPRGAPPPPSYQERPPVASSDSFRVHTFGQASRHVTVRSLTTATRRSRLAWASGCVSLRRLRCRT
jgi:hypothetical protein